MTKINNKNLGNVRQKISIITLIFFCITLLSLLSNLFGFYKSFLLGVFGLLSYPIVIIGITLSIMSLMNRPIRFDFRNLTISTLLLLFFVCILQLALTSSYDMSSFGAYLTDCYTSKNTPAGLLVGLLIYPVQSLLFVTGAYVIFGIMIVIMLALFVDSYYDKFHGNNSRIVSNVESINIANKPEKSKKKLVNDDVVEKEDIQVLAKKKLGLLDSQDDVQDAKTYLYGNNTKNDAIRKLYPEKNLNNNSLNPNFLENSLDKYMEGGKSRNSRLDIKNVDNTQQMNKVDYSKSAKFINSSIPKKVNSGIIISGDDKTVTEVKGVNTNSTKTSETKSFNNNIEKYDNEKLDTKDYQKNNVYNENFDKYDDSPKNDLNKMDNYKTPQNDYSNADFNDEYDDSSKQDNTTIGKNKPKIFIEDEESLNFKEFNDIDPVMPKQAPKLAPSIMYSPKNYVRPPLSLLTVTSTDLSDMEEDTIKKTHLLEQALEDFRVPAKVRNVVVGPSVTRYELIMPPGISVKKILGFADDIAMSLASKGGVRIEAPIPGKSAVGIEVPNSKQATIGLRDVLDSSAFYEMSSPLTFALGKDIGGNLKFCDLAKAPHLLIAGSTGSGKSVCLNTLIVSLLYKSSPEDLRIILIDPKRVEFAPYEGIPHLMLPNIITEPDKALNAFNWAINEMEKRNITFLNTHVRDIGEYNQLDDVMDGSKPKMPYIVLIADEVADLLSTNKRELEEKIARLTAKARSAGIHLVLATQRPSVDVITGTIKNNLPTRIAFSLTSSADSKTILDQGGADKLLGKGDMLYLPQGQAEPTRIQGTFVSNNEIRDIVEYVKQKNEAVFEDNIENKMLNKNYGQMDKLSPANLGCSDELFVPALKIVIESNQPTASMLQRRLGLGWNRASKLIDAMEAMGYITPLQTGKQREVLMTIEEFVSKYGDI